MSALHGCLVFVSEPLELELQMVVSLHVDPWNWLLPIPTPTSSSGRAVWAISPVSFSLKLFFNYKIKFKSQGRESASALQHGHTLSALCTSCTPGLVSDYIKEIGKLGSTVRRIKRSVYDCWWLDGAHSRPASHGCLRTEWQSPRTGH